MSGTIHLYRDGRMCITTDEAPDQASIEMISRTIRDGGTLVLGKGWDLVHEPTGFDGRYVNPHTESTEHTSRLAIALTAFLAGMFGVFLGALLMAAVA